MSVDDHYEFQCRIIDYSRFFSIYRNHTKFHEYLYCMNNNQHARCFNNVEYVENAWFCGHKNITIVKASTSDLRQFPIDHYLNIYLIPETQQIFQCNDPVAFRAFICAKPKLEVDYRSQNRSI